MPIILSNDFYFEITFDIKYFVLPYAIHDHVVSILSYYVDYVFTDEQITLSTVLLSN